MKKGPGTRQCTWPDGWVDGLSALSVNGQEALFRKPLPFGLGQLPAQRAFFDIAGYVFPLQAGLLVVAAMQFLEDFDSLPAG
jgi:hypothetical protein